MNKKIQLIKKTTTHKKKLYKSKNISGLSAIILSSLITSSVSYAGQPKAGDIISSMPTDNSLLNKWGQATKPVKEPSTINEDITVFVKRFEFRGNSKIKSSKLREILSKFIKKNLL